MKIHATYAREILDSRGNPTISTTVELDDGVIAEASVPSGASIGSGEDLEIRDNDSDRFGGLGVLSAISNVNNVIGPAILGFEGGNQKLLDEKINLLDDTEKKENLGANAILSVSLANARAQSISCKLELFEYLALLFWGQKKDHFSLPIPMFNVLNGGAHAENNIDIQETMAVPIGFKSFEEKLRSGAEIYHILRNNLINQGLETGLGDEGGFAPVLSSNELVFKLIDTAIAESSYNDSQIKKSIDLAANSVFDIKKNVYLLKNGNQYLGSEELISIISNWVKKYNLLSVEDGLAEKDPNWKKLTAEITPAISIGDDLFVTNPEKIELGSKEMLAGGVIIKPNQIGTLSETFNAVKKAKEGKMKVIVSHRSGETEDSFISDLAVAVEADYIKSGAPARSERLAKYNRLCKIEDVIRENYE